VDRGGAELARQLQPGRQQIGGHYLHSLQGQEAGEHQPDWSLPGHQHRVAAQQREGHGALDCARVENRSCTRGLVLSGVRARQAFYRDEF
jgi:hypothetical protein